MFKKICGMLLIIVLVIGFFFFNLKGSSVYYAKHTPHKDGVEPVLMELVDNLDWIYTPEIDGLKYDYDGFNSIINEAKGGGDGIVIFSADPDDGYVYFHENYDYVFDHSFKLIRIFNHNKNRREPLEVDPSKIKQEIYQAMQPLIDQQIKPLINLQWLYDLLNRDRFN